MKSLLIRVALCVVAVLGCMLVLPAVASAQTCTYPCNNPGGICPRVVVTHVTPITSARKFTVTVEYSGAQWMNWGFWNPGVEYVCSEASNAECSSAPGTHTKQFDLVLPCIELGETVDFNISVDACRVSGRPGQWASGVTYPVAPPAGTRCDPSIPEKQPPPNQEAEACEIKGKDEQCNSCKGSPCYVASGVYETLASDLQIPTNGFPLSLGRVYNSGHAIDGPMGPGWTSSLDSRIFYTTAALGSPSTSQTTSFNEAEVVLPDGTHRTFRAPGPTLPTTTPITFFPPSGRDDGLVRNPDGTWDLTIQHSLSVYHFDATGRLETLTDDFGNRLRMTYDVVGRVQRIADESGSGRFLNVYWGPNGRIADVTDNSGRVVHYDYDGAGMLTRSVDPANRGTNYVYTAGRYVPVLSAIQDPWGRVLTELTWEENEFGKPTGRLSSYSEEGVQYRYRYEPELHQTVKEQMNGGAVEKTWVFPYQQNNDLITQRQGPDGTSSTEYDSAGRVISSTDPAGIRTQYGWTAAGVLNSVTQALGTADQVRYDYGYDASFPWKVTSVVPKDPDTSALDRDWQETRYEYYPPGATAPGSLHKVLRVKANGSSEVVTTYEYDAKGRVTRVLDALGNATDAAYDTAGNLATVTRPANDDLGTRPVVSYGYDALGRVTTITEGQAITEITYDAVDRVTQTKVRKNGACNGGEVCEFLTGVLYDQYEAGQQRLWVHQTDANGIVTKQAYDTYGRLVISRDAENNDTRYTYANKHLVGITDANDYTTGYLYDTAGRLWKTIFPDGAEESYTYSADGLLATKTDRKGNVIGYLYDAHKRLVQKVYNNGTDGTIQFVYEGQKLVRVENRSQGVNEDHIYTYDAGYRTASEQQGPRGTVRWEYDLRDQVSRMSVDGGPTTDYSYYPDGSMNTITWSLVSGQFKYRYTPQGQYATVTFPNGQSRNYSYDWAGRLLQLANLHPTAGNLATYSYGYDTDWATGLKTKKGQRTSMTADVPAQGFANALTKYLYGPNYQLVGADYPSAAPFNGEVARWAYDAIGNRTSETVNGVTTNYTYQKVGANPKNTQRLASEGANSYSYDSNGNLTARGADVFSWGVRNYLNGITGPSVASYMTDYYGRRPSKTDADATNQFIFDRENLIAQVGAGGASYVFGSDVDEPLAVVQGGAVHYFDVDALGSTTMLTEPNGTAQNRYAYDAWGKARDVVEATTNLFTYTGREKADLGLLYYRARYYDPRMGRFTQEDPLVSDRPAYSYALNSPAWFVDPSGAVQLKRHAPTYETGTHDQVMRVCDGNWKARGCMSPIGTTVTCKCRCVKAGFKLEITMTLKTRVIVRNDDPRSSIEEITREENKHVKAADDVFNEHAKIGEGYERVLYQSGDKCWDACEKFQKKVQAAWADAHDAVDCTHPERFCISSWFGKE